MILDRLELFDRYAPLLPGMAAGLDFLRTADWDALPDGRHPIDGDRVFALLASDAPRRREGARLEAHRRHADLQFTISGREWIGWRPLAGLSAEAPFDEAKDIGFFRDRPDTWLCLPPGMLALFLPEDAHAPLAGDAPVRKAVVKVRLP